MGCSSSKNQASEPKSTKNQTSGGKSTSQTIKKPTTNTKGSAPPVAASKPEPVKDPAVEQKQKEKQEAMRKQQEEAMKKEQEKQK